MKTPPIDNISAGYIVAYDVKTGAVFWIHEKIVEVIRGREECPARITAQECESVRVEAARVFRGREVSALVAPEGFAPRDGMRLEIDLRTKKLKEIPEPKRGIADRFAYAGD